MKHSRPHLAELFSLVRLVWLGPELSLRIGMRREQDDYRARANDIVSALDLWGAQPIDNVAGRFEICVYPKSPRAVIRCNWRQFEFKGSPVCIENHVKGKLIIWTYGVQRYGVGASAPIRVVPLYAVPRASSAPQDFVQTHA